MANQWSPSNQSDMGLSPMSLSFLPRTKLSHVPRSVSFHPVIYPLAIAIETARAVSHNNTKPAIFLCSCQAHICSPPSSLRITSYSKSWLIYWRLGCNIRTRRSIILRVNALRARKAFCTTRTPTSDDLSFQILSAAAHPTFMYR
jgi:hypothetical protein